MKNRVPVNTVEVNENTTYPYTRNEKRLNLVGKTVTIGGRGE